MPLPLYNTIRMNKNIPIISVIVAIILAAGVAFMIRSQSQTAPQPLPRIVSDTTKNTGTTTETQSLKNLMRRGVNQQCTFQDPDSGNSGAIYTSSGKFRGDFTSTINGKTTASHMFSDGQDIYMWMGDEKSGFKMPMATLENPDGADSAVPKTVDINKQVDYSCTPWNSNEVTLNVPTDVTFSDFSGMMQLPKTTTGVDTGAGNTNMDAPCAACNTLNGEAQTQCKAALNCR